MINDVAALLLERLGADLAPHYVDARPEELRNSVADIGFAGKLIGYWPRFSLEDKIDEVISAHRTTARSADA
jgi:nucleoside-diphosphate-sugar epimerase